MPDWKNLREKARAAVNNAAQEVDRQITLAKLRTQVGQARTALNEAYQELGGRVYQALKQEGTVNGQDPALQEAMRAVDDRHRQLEDAQAALDAESGPDHNP